MKYQQTHSWFLIKGPKRWGKGPHKVQPFNGEPNDMSWSEGFTHFRDGQDRVGFCGTHYFENTAKEVK